MGIEKVAGFFLAAAGGFIVLSATFVFALITYRRRRERGFFYCFLPWAVACS
jgi:hypothetical protein